MPKVSSSHKASQPRTPDIGTIVVIDEASMVNLPSRLAPPHAARGRVPDRSITAANSGLWFSYDDERSPNSWVSIFVVFGIVQHV